MYIESWWERQKERSQGRPRRRWEGHILMDRKETRQGGSDQIHLIQDSDMWRAVVNSVIDLQILGNVGKYLNS